MSKISKKEAMALWGELRNNLLNAERVLIEIVKARAWEAQGYSTFIEAWTAELSGVRLANDTMRAAVVYAMIDEGLTNEEIARSGAIGDARIDRVREMKANGVQPEDVRQIRVKPNSHPVRPHVRSNPGPQQTIHVTLNKETIQHYKDVAKAAGLDFSRAATDAITDRFRVLEAELKVAG